MDERQKIQERLRKKEQEIQTLEEKLKAAKSYVHALHDVLLLLGDQSPPAAAESVLRPRSAVAQARDVILKRGKPVHIGELLEALGKVASRESRASLTSSLAAYVRRGEIFTRPAPNTFGLIELGHATPPEVGGPPSGFGRIVAPPRTTHPRG
jgi:chorismate-pyruvate lyase